MGNTQDVMAREPFYYTHTGKNILLLFLSIVTVPISAALVFLNLAISALNDRSRQSRQNESTRRKTILVTGVSMTKGLSIARSLSQNTPHRIIGADISRHSSWR
jgi:hypothetical protein